MKYILIIMLLLQLYSCTTVKPYERQYINDPEMQTSKHADEGFRNYVYSIREGSTPVDNPKASGGCGCN